MLIVSMRGMVIAIVVTLAGLALAQESQPSRPDTSRASCVLAFDRPVGSSGVANALTMDIVTAMLTSTEVADPAAKSALGLDAADWSKVAQVQVQSVGPERSSSSQAVKVLVLISPLAGTELPANAASRLLDELVRRTESGVKRLTESPRLELQTKIESLQQRRTQLQTKVGELQAHLASTRGMSTSSATSTAAVSRERVQADLAEKELRLNATKAVRARAEAVPQSDVRPYEEVVRRWDDMVVALEEAVKAGKAQELELLRARTDQAEARLKLHEKTRSGSDLITNAWNLRLLDMEVEVEVLRGRLQSMGEPEKPEAPPQPLRPETISQQLSDAQREQSQVENQLRDAEQQLERLANAPRLIVLRGEPADGPAEKP